MEKRSLFQKMFGGKSQPVVVTEHKMLNAFTPTFYPWSGNLYESDIARAAISTNASNVGKLNPKHIRRSGTAIQDFPDLNIKRLLSRPNPYMSMYDLLYKVAVQREENNNAFVFLHFDALGILEGIYPVQFTSATMVETSDGELYVTFLFFSGQKVTLPYRDMIHIRKHFNKHDIYGDSNIAPMRPTLEIINTTNQGIVNAIKNSAFLRGLLMWKQVLQPDDVKANTDKFVKDYMSINNNGGVASTDPRFEYKELKSEPYVPSKQVLDHTKDRIYSYFGTNEKIVQSKFTEDEWNAYYENTIEPIAIQLGLEFTEKMFTERERGHGNEIVFEANRLQYASTTTKLNLREMVDRGAMTPNEWRMAFNLAPLEGGDKPIRRLDTAPVQTKPVPSKEGDAANGN